MQANAHMRYRTAGEGLLEAKAVERLATGDAESRPPSAALGPHASSCATLARVSRSDIPRWVGPAYIAMALILVPWIVYLRATLPTQEMATHYRLAWVGFDVIEFGQLVRTGLYAIVPRWRDRMRQHAAASAALLIVDAWFDCTTSPSNQLVSSIVMAVLVELPLAGLCWWLALRELPESELAEGELAGQGTAAASDTPGQAAG